MRGISAVVREVKVEFATNIGALFTEKVVYTVEL